nr:protein tyrosine phosphatase family protein [Duganella violaceicalia]
MHPCPSGAGAKSRDHTVVKTRRAVAVLTLLTGLLAWGTASATDSVIEAPNAVEISPRLVTSGQPGAKALAGLAAQGFGAVIYLAPPTVSDAIAGEAEIVRRQGLEFINIPIGFGNPTEADFQAFVAAMERLRDRKVLVHCQVNMRASSMTFLYRAIVLHEKPELAYESVARVWSPEGPWKSLLVSQLRKAGIQFEPY